MPSLASTIAVAVLTVAIFSCSSPVDLADRPNQSIAVVDGDTVDVDDTRIRLIGINTPETDECGGDLATQALNQLLTASTHIDLIADISDTDQFGRQLRYIHADGIDVGAELIREGWAIARTYPPNTTRDTRYTQLQVDAQTAQLGIWQPDLCGPPIDADITITIAANPPGPDLDNLNAETITLTNNANTPIDLTGWTIADESAGHRYHFPTGTTLNPHSSLTVHSGCGTPTPSDQYWCATGSAIWNNNGDTAYLKDPNGNIHQTQPTNQ